VVGTAARGTVPPRARGDRAPARKEPTWPLESWYLVAMGDKSPKSKDKNKKQDDAQKKRKKDDAVKKQAPPAVTDKKK